MGDAVIGGDFNARTCNDVEFIVDEDSGCGYIPMPSDFHGQHNSHTCTP
jgi:hypothetical protein